MAQQKFHLFCKRNGPHIFGNFIVFDKKQDKKECDQNQRCAPKKHIAHRHDLIKQRPADKRADSAAL